MNSDKDKLINKNMDIFNKNANIKQCKHELSEDELVIRGNLW